MLPFCRAGKPNPKHKSPLKAHKLIALLLNSRQQKCLIGLDNRLEFMLKTINKLHPVHVQITFLIHWNWLSRLKRRIIHQCRRAASRQFVNLSETFFQKLFMSDETAKINHFLNIVLSPVHYYGVQGEEATGCFSTNKRIYSLIQRLSSKEHLHVSEFVMLYNILSRTFLPP